MKSPDLLDYNRRSAESAARRKQPLTPENGPTVFKHVLALPRVIDETHSEFTPGLGDPRAPLLDALPTDYKIRYPRLPAIKKVRAYHEQRICVMPPGHWEGSFITAEANENITSKSEDLVSAPPRRYCHRWETWARRLSTELRKDIRPAYGAFEGSPHYWMTQTRYRPCFFEGYDWFADYENGAPVHCWYQGFTEAQLRIPCYTDYRRDCVIRCWELANQRIENAREE